MLPSSADLIETFALLPDWEARYAYLIDLGRALPPMDPGLKVDAVLVSGCTSRVWLVGEKKDCHPGQAERDPGSLSGLKVEEDPGSPLRFVRDDSVYFHFTLDSDAAIVKGLCAVLLVFVQDRSADEIRALDMHVTFEKLGLAAHLSPNRRNGFFAMVERVKKIAT